MAENRNTRTEALIGKERLEILGDKKIIVFGLGGVGGILCEALIRGNISCITIVDYDTISISNLNRQLISTEKSIGNFKTDEMEKRLLSINSKLQITKWSKKVAPDNINDFHLENYDYVIDCVDDILAKESIIKAAMDLEIPVISSMGAGNLLDNTKFQVAELRNSSYCPLARAMRRKLDKKYHSVKVVFSTAQPVKKTREAPSSISFVPPTVGLMIAGEVLRDLMEWREE